MPLRLGGGGHRRIEDLLASIRGASGSLMDGDDDTEIAVENKAIARLLATGIRAATSRACQADSRKLSHYRRPVALPDGTSENLSPLERWEWILGLRPPPSITLTQRRDAVAVARSLTGGSTMGTLRTAMEAAFAPWPVSVTLTPASALTATDAYWPGGANTPAYPGSAPSGTNTWRSNVARVNIDVDMPGTPAQAEQDRRKRAAEVVLDKILPASADWAISLT